MRRNIIVEGMDGSGKDTLIAQLTDIMTPTPTLHERFCTSKGGPLATGNELAALITVDAFTMPDSRPYVIYNRHSIISDPIYCGLRGGPEGVWTSAAWVNAYQRWIAKYAVVILCQPPFEEVDFNIRYDHNQMPGVADHARELYDAYAALVWPGPTIRYDYTRDTPQDIVNLLGKVLD